LLACRAIAGRSELYESDWKVWFGQEGDPRHGTADDPRIVLLDIDIHAGVFLEVNKPKPVVLFELAKGWLTGERVEPGQLDVRIMRRMPK
jgi:hypothetical protein